MDKELRTEIGQKWFFSDDNILASKLFYLQGIEKFDAELNHENEYGHAVNFIQHPKGILIKFSQNFSSISFGLGFVKISALQLISMADYSFLIIKLQKNDLYFGILNENIPDLIEFLKSTKLDLGKDISSKIDINVERKFRNYLLKYTDQLKINTSNIASPKWKRFVNSIIDNIIIFSITYLILGSNLEAYNHPIHPFLISYFSFSIYYLLFEGAFRTTIGKIVTNTRIVSSDGTRADAISILVRTLSRIIPLEPLSFLNNDKAGWHDNLSKTVVIDNAKRKTIAKTQ